MLVNRASFTHHELMADALPTLEENVDWRQKIVETLEAKHEAIAEIDRMEAIVAEAQVEIDAIREYMQLNPDPDTELYGFDWATRLIEDQKFYNDRIALMRRCIETFDRYVAAVQPLVGSNDG